MADSMSQPETKLPSVLSSLRTENESVMLGEYASARLLTSGMCFGRIHAMPLTSAILVCTAS
jgi:hypothetical protein